MDAVGDVNEPGDLRWAKLEGHPWWPGIVCKSPQSSKSERVTKGGLQFHIHFFSDPPTRAWIKAKNIRTYHGSDAPECHPGGTFHCTKSAFRTAVKEADKAQFFTIQERIAFVKGQNEGDDSSGSDSYDELVELDKMPVDSKKRKMSAGKGSSPKRRKMGPASASGRPELLRQYDVDDPDIPELWTTTYVLMNTNDVPEDLTPEGSHICKKGRKEQSAKKKPGPKSSQRKPAVEPESTLDIESESEEDVPKRKPGPKSKTKPAVEPLDIDSESEEDVPKRKSGPKSKKKPAVEPLDIDSESEEDVPKRKPGPKSKKKPTVEPLDIDSESEEDVPKRKPGPKSKKKPTVEPLDIDSESEEDVPKRKPGPKSKTKQYEDDFDVKTPTSDRKKPGTSKSKHEAGPSSSGKGSGKRLKTKPMKAAPRPPKAAMKAKFEAAADADKENRLVVVKKKRGRQPKDASAANKSAAKKKGRRVVDEEEEMDEEDLMDSDEDPEYSEEEMEESDVDPEEDLTDSDADPDWGDDDDGDEPKTKKFGNKKDLAGKKKTAGRKKLTGIKEKSAVVTRTPAKIKSTGSLKLYKPPDTVRKVTDEEDEPIVNELPPDDTSKAVVVKESKSTGPEPDPGEFLIEMEECKDGNIPYLWRYKKGGLVQKYKKVVENGKTFYQNMLCFSDWWPCYSDKYLQVAAQIMFKYRNKEKVMLTAIPSFVHEKNQSKDGSQEKSAPTESAKSPTSDSVMEQEISSTTPEHESSAENAFQVGNFVLAKEDERNVDNFSIWKIESAILLKKYEAVIREGKLFHKPVKTTGRGVPVIIPRDLKEALQHISCERVRKAAGVVPSKYLFTRPGGEPTNVMRAYECLAKACQLADLEYPERITSTSLRKYMATITQYRGYQDITKTYKVINAKKVPGFVSEDLVEVAERSRPKLIVDYEMEEEYDKNPMLHHFYVYLQVFLSQALEPGFMAEIKKSDDETYLFPLAEVDKIVSQKTTMIERKVRWASKIKDALHKFPYLRTVQMQKVDDKKTCEAVADTTDTLAETAYLFGAAYDEATLQPVGTVQPSQEFHIGKTAAEHITVYHQLCHFRFNLYDKCMAKIKMVTERKEDEIDVTEVMDGCLGNKVWVLQNFEDFMKLVN